ncbi:hypothetical protein SMMN14_05103 [Sphaerulina musiva]
MHLIPVTLLSLSIGALAGCPNVQKRDDRPGGAAAIESAVNSLYTGTNLPSNLASLEPALSSAGVTGVVVSDTTYGTSQPTGTGQGNNNNNNGNNDGGNNGQGGQNDNGQGNSDNNNDQGNSNNNGNGNDNDNGSNQNNDNNQNSGTSTSDGLAAATSVPQVLMAGGFGAVGMAVLGML